VLQDAAIWWDAVVAVLASLSPRLPLDSVRAIAVTAGGESGDPSSKHFGDQAKRYATGDLRPVYFYPSQLKGHVEREYHPGS